MSRSITLARLRRHAIARSLFTPSTLGRVIDRLGFVQADPIRAPARAQDLTLRHRVIAYRAGELERRYPRLALEEDTFVNYGFLPRTVQMLMHPRTPRQPWSRARWRQARTVQQWVAERGVVHPLQVNAHFAQGKVRNWFGGSSNATTQLLDAMHYRGLLRIARREGGIRLYAVREPTAAAADPGAAFDSLVDRVVALYAPLPAASLGKLLSHLCGGVPQWRADRGDALRRARQRLARARIDGLDWYWPCEERLRAGEPDDAVRLLAPFDPVVWDRLRFELFWGWAYRFEAYTPAARRKLGYYALPVLWRDAVIGWANVGVAGDALRLRLGFIAGSAPRDPTFARELEAELARLQAFLRPT